MVYESSSSSGKMATVEKAFSECVALSNEGATLINEGCCYERAIHKMTAALKLCRWSLRRFTATTSPCSKAGQDEGMKFDVDILIETEPLRDSLVADQNGAFVYKRAIHLPDLLGKCPLAIHVVSLVISFNMGLAHHLQAIRCCSSSSSSSSPSSSQQQRQQQRHWMGRALQFYKATQKLQRRRCSGSKALLSLALINNMGHVFQSLQEVRTSISYYNRVLSLILFMTSYKKMDSRIYEPFLQNALPVHQGFAVAA